MEPIEYKPARRPWVREILVGTATNVIAALVVAAVLAAARHLI
ncbi:DUF6408 family protein [Streptomyces sp. NPDC005840]|uniref:DUF6408 family protein n=1 Tax=Streptomyces doudnae TaxID=3075536 RepID=A0ABD5EZB2_9ACTN|nr:MULTISPECIES: DUF6408 family protein [unclassified Streptomyces]MDT0439563.1 DUF6408 family protein [Streptomyces sp. DSM 41981]SCE46701.1 hypothetical protein GA0115242_139515 [Streptomyces sp. SolWspMP-5a-2]